MAMRASRRRTCLAFAFFMMAAGLSRAQEAPSYRSELDARARRLGLSWERRWQRLLHYRVRGRTWRSEADGPGFFLSPQGRDDPQAELEATLAAFFELPPEDSKSQHPQCRFPARYSWLKERLAFDSARLPERPCPDFSAWREAIGARAVSLVFADAFLGNPSSMFGHTFLRLHRRADGPADALLDYTLNFEAIPDTDNAILYTLRGLDGSFRGEYSLMPFYMKTQAYSSLESRDLWDYRLNLTQAQIDLLIEHAWELGSTYFDYYFFTKNCSYQLLTLLETADDSLDLSAGFRLTVVPADTVRALISRPGLVAEAHYRPSYVTEMRARRARLSRDELSAATRLGRRVDAAGLGAIGSWPPRRQALVLDSAHDYLRYRAGFTLQQDTETLKAEHALLVARGRLGEPPLPPEVVRPSPLETGHGTSRVGLGFGANRSFSFEEFSWRATLHDLPASGEGYTPDSQLEGLNTRLRVDNVSRRPYLERLDVVDIVALSPWDPWVRKPSWRFSTGVDQAKELGCNGPSCMYYDLGGGAGLTAQTRLGRRELYFAMAEADFGAAPLFDRGWRAGAGGTAGLMLDLSRSCRALIEATYIAYAYSPAQQRLRLTGSWRLSRDLELRLDLDRRVPDEEAGLSFFVHF